MKGTYKVDANGTLLGVGQQQLSYLRRLLLDDDLSARVSDLLMLDLHAFDVGHDVRPADATREIRSLEPGGGPTRTKAATPFDRLPLRGLWHKHFISNGTVARPHSAPMAEGPERELLTGDWIIYLPHEGRNYYLCLSTHDTEDHVLLERILKHCLRDFPELPEWLAAARASR